MAKPPVFDGTFHNNYRAIWAQFFGKALPLPEDVARGITSAVGAGWLGHKALVDAFKVAPGCSTKLWWQTRARFSFQTEKGLEAHSEGRSLLFAGFIAIYGGLLLGTAIVAAYETYGARVYAMIRPLAIEVERATGRSFADALEAVLNEANFSGTPFFRAMDVGRAVSNPKLYRRGGASGDW